MMQLLNEFNQDKINKIVNEFVRQVKYYDIDTDYQTDAAWIRAAVMHLDHLRQNKMQHNRMMFIARNVVATPSLRNDLVQGKWQYITYRSFLNVINAFEPSMQMRHIQQQYEKTNHDERKLHETPVVLQNDDHFLVMRAETPNAAIEARERIEKATLQQYSWCISSKSNNLFYKYRVENKKNPVTAYFVWDKTKPIDDAWHAFVVHAGNNTIMFTNAENRNPETIAANATSKHLQGIDVSKLIVQPLTRKEQDAVVETHAISSSSYFTKPYDEKTKLIQQRIRFSMSQYAMLDKKQQHLYVHYLNPNEPATLDDALESINKVFQPVTETWARGLDIIDRTREHSIDALLQNNEPFAEFLKYTWSQETKDYYYMIAQRAINNAAAIILRDYV